MNTSLSKDQQAFLHFIPEAMDLLQRVADTYLESFDEHAAFVHLIAELYETTDEEKFVFTDGARDGGIDFIIRDAPSYAISQCKCPAISTLEKGGEIPKFDQAPLEELESAISMLLDRKGEYDVKPAIKRLRGDYQRDYEADPETTNLTAILAVLGELSEPAKKAFASRRSALAKESVHLKLIEWYDIYQTLHARESPADVDFSIDIHFDDKDKDLLRHSEYCYILVHGRDFYQAFRDHEWNLFEWNVRLQMHNSPINRRIVAALSTAKGRKLFHHYNNGLLVTCKSYRIDEPNKKLRLVGPQIVNGCQTVRAICEAFENLTPENQKHFEEHVRVQTKVIKTIDPEFIGELVISTNDQNPMNPRNLKSNTAEQRDIQKSFRELPIKWFYERKDGEMKSLLSTSSRVRWFRKSDYAVAPRSFRFVDNERLAKAWYSFTGNSHIALRGGIDYFSDDPYTKISKSITSPSFWSAYSEINFVQKENYFEPGRPSVYQYLLAFGIAKFIDGRRISYKLNKDQAILRGIDRGELEGNKTTGELISAARDVDEYLAKDVDYFINIMINNMREVLIELFSFLLCVKYSACDAISCQKIISMPNELKFYDGGFHNTVLPQGIQDGKSILGPIYEFLLDCVKQYYFKFEAEIKAAPRLKSYLAQRPTINRFRELVIERDLSTREYDAKWKKPRQSFIESLPELPA